jgi:hypothetical protein
MPARGGAQGLAGGHANLEMVRRGQLEESPGKEAKKKAPRGVRRARCGTGLIWLINFLFPEGRRLPCSWPGRTVPFVTTVGILHQPRRGMK